MTLLATALEAGDVLSGAPAAALQQRLGIPNERLDLYREVLAADVDRGQLIAALRASAATSSLLRSINPEVEVAWTYPGSARPGLRTTGGIAREIIEQANLTILVVGYSVTVDPARAGLAARTIDAIADVAKRGVSITAVLHRNANRDALLQAWPKTVKEPRIFTWPATEDEMASIHAKVLVADRADALVTSANLTYHGMEANLEMGVRVRGRPAAEIGDRFFDLIARGHLKPWPT